MRDIEHPQISMVQATGYPTKEHSDWEQSLEDAEEDSELTEDDLERR